MLMKVQDENMQVNLVPESFISGLQQKKPLDNNCLRLLSDGENKTDPIHYFVVLKKFEKNIPIINNGGEHTRKIEGGVSLLQLFSCNHKADSRITCSICF